MTELTDINENHIRYVEEITGLPRNEILLVLKAEREYYIICLRKLIQET